MIVDLLGAGPDKKTPPELWKKKQNYFPFFDFSM